MKSLKTLVEEMQREESSRQQQKRAKEKDRLSLAIQRIQEMLDETEINALIDEAKQEVLPSPVIEIGQPSVHGSTWYRGLIWNYVGEPKDAHQGSASWNQVRIDIRVTITEDGVSVPSITIKGKEANDLHSNKDDVVRIAFAQALTYPEHCEESWGYDTTP